MGYRSNKGYSDFEAAEEAEEKCRKVLAYLQASRRDLLPFDFSSSNEFRLLGKQRARDHDSLETLFIRQHLNLRSDLLDLILSLGDKLFEKICAGLMLLSGASDAIAICAADEGGIDIYGRIALRNREANILPGLIETSLLHTPTLLFMGQCKCERLDSRIGRPKLVEFQESVRACLDKYSGNPRPPSNRVPGNYFGSSETCVRVVFTTASYADPAVAYAQSVGIFIVDGQQIAQFMLRHKVGLAYDQEQWGVSRESLICWIGKSLPNENTFSHCPIAE